MPSTYWAIGLAVLVTVGVVPGVAAAQLEEPLEDGHIYWQGTLISADGFAPDAEEAELYRQSGDHVRNITLDDGDLELDTNGLQGEYYVTAPSVDRVRFEIVEQVVDVNVEVSRTTEGPPYVVADVGISTNRGDAVLRVSGFDEFADYVDGEVERIDDDTLRVGMNAEFTVELDHLAGSDATISAEDPVTGAYGNEIYEVPPITQPPRVDAVAAERGGEYWAGDVLAFESATTHEFYRVETVSGEQVAEKQAATNGRLYVNTSGYSGGAYRVLNESGDELTRFGVDVQELNATVEGKTLLLKSNRGGYNATITISNNSTYLTSQVFPDANGQEKSLTSVENEKQIALATDRLAPGEYVIQITTEATVNATATFSVAEETPTRTETPTPTSTATATTTSTPIPTGSEAVAESPTASKTKTSAPGFGVTVALVAVLVFLVVGSYRWE